MTLTIGSLFSGIGGLEKGLEMAGLGPVLWQVEKDAGCRAVLAHHWPDVERFDDVCAVGTVELRRVDLICGGFPCQDVSSAGKQAGLAGARSGLWYEFARIIADLRPRLVVVENVASGAKLWLDTVCGSLGKLGYASLPIPIAASDVGAPHRRNRIFVVAHADSEAVRVEQGRSIGESGRAQGEPVDPCASDAPNALQAGLSRPRTRAQESGRGGSSTDHWRSPMPDMVRVVHGVSGGTHSTNDISEDLERRITEACAAVYQGVALREVRCDRGEARAASPRPPEAVGRGGSLLALPHGRGSATGKSSRKTDEDLHGVLSRVRGLHTQQGENVRAGVPGKGWRDERTQALGRRTNDAGMSGHSESANPRSQREVYLQEAWDWSLAHSARSRIASLGNSVVPQCSEVVGHVIQKLIGAST